MKNPLWLSAILLVYFHGNFDTIPESTALPIDTITTEQIRAMNAALFYLDNTWFSHAGLVEQLEIDEYTHETAMYAADQVGI